MNKNPIIRNSKGEQIVLTELEKRFALHNEKAIKNAFGIEISMTTLTTIVKKVSEQKYFEIKPAEFLPIVVGEGAWSSNLIHYRSFAFGDDFATGVLNQGANSARLAAADAGVDSLTVKVVNWAKTIGWNLIELEQAAKAGNWDLVTAKEESRLKNWQLGIQKVAFLGLSGDSSVLGLLNQPLTFDTTTIQKKISSMTTTELKAFCASILNVYRVNCNYTAWPTHFVMPESDYLGLAAPTSADFPLKSTLEVLLDTFKVMTGNQAFKILPLRYADKAVSGQAYDQYVLLNYDEKSLRMNIPVDYTSTLAQSIDGFNLQNVAYGQFSGVVPIRPLELMYFKF